ncbi:MAG TPA: hypothetical protein V6D25_03685 [Leptolyngbyaceae cyanobacterium]
MKAILTVTEIITREAHIDIAEGQSQEAIRQEIVDRYNTGQIANSFNITHVDFQSFSAQIIPEKE